MSSHEINQLKKYLQTDMTYFSYDERIKLLKKMKQMLVENENLILQALKSDLGKPDLEAYTSEIAVLLNEIDYITKHLKKWMKQVTHKQVKVGYRSTIRKVRQPFGRVLIISPWNYPLQLALLPTINALSAGNACVIKPSEYAGATSELLRKIIHLYFPAQTVQVVTGDARQAKALIDLNFDFIFFTGSQKTGAKVYQQAAKQLKPVAMELGGRNACILDETALTKANIKEIVWGKFFNAGQTCIAPNALFVHTTIYDRLLAELKNTLLEFYGEATQPSVNYSRIIHASHLNRLQTLLKLGHVYHGGHVDLESLYLAPTILTEVNLDSRLVTEEIFGPILPVIPFQSLESLFENNLIQTDALITYIFSQSDDHIHFISEKIKSTVSINQVIHHASNHDLPFGGIGESGFGAYHGRAGFETFTYVKAQYRANHYRYIATKFPPYSNKALQGVKKMRKWLF